MNKEDFLLELKGQLLILEEREQQDILEEYSQHIDMKMQKGLSEEEAIRDFGSVKELAAGILEAYHVNPNYEGARKKKTLDFAKGKAKDRGKFLKKAGNFLGGGVQALGKGIEKGAKWLVGKVKSLFSLLAKPFSRKEGEKTMKTEVIHTARKEGGFWSRLWGIVLALWRLFLSFMAWVIRLFWNLCCLFFGLLGAGCTMILVFGLGAALVLLPQGYPLKGAALICLGGILCVGAFALACFSLIRRKAKMEDAEGQEAYEEEKGEEVQYE